MNVRGNKLTNRGIRGGLIVFFSVVLSFGVQAQNITAAKAYTKMDGFYRVAASNLAEVFSITESEVASTAYYVENMGLEVASSRDGGDVIFYAHRYKGPYTDENVFWIKPGDPAVLPTMSVGQGYTPFQDSFPMIKRFEQHDLIKADLVADVDEDPILWRMLTSGLITKKYAATISIDAPVSGATGFLSVRLKGGTDLAGRYYHRARIDLNGVTLGTIDFEGLESKEVSFPVSAGQWLDGNNIVLVESTPPPGTYFDSFFLDNIHADYDRDFVAFNNRLTVPVDSSSIEILGFDSDAITLWDVTDQWGIRELSGHQVIQDGALWKLTFDATENVEVAAVASGSELLPVKILPADDIGLKDAAREVDHLVISCPTLVDSAVDISIHRASQGMDAETITINDVYDAFNYGIRDARALTRFLNHAYRNWAKHPRYVVLVGDGSLDNLNVMGFNDSQIPAVPLMGPNGLYASDYTYGDPTGTGQLEMAVGRIPVNSVSELDDYISKMCNYEDGGAWRDNKLISTDQNDYGGDFLGIGNELSTLIDGNVHRGDLTTQGISEVRSAVIDGINEGREVSLYVGHGTPNQLSSQSILLDNDMVSLTNGTSPTAFVAIGCLIGAFNDPGKVNLGEGLVTADGGAAAVAAAATLISAADGQVLSEAFLDEIYQFGTDRIGDAWITGKNELTAAYRQPAFKAFQLMGDPATAVGSATSAREGSGAPSQPEYDEWSKTVVPPVLEDMGVTLLPEEDEDGDDSSNFDEFKAGTDPFDSGSYLEIVKIKRPNPGYVEVSWPSSADRVYTVESATTPLGPYTELVTGVNATTPLNSEVFAEDTSVPHFYRVVIE